MQEKTIFTLGLIGIFSMGLVIGDSKEADRPKVKLVQMTIEDNEFYEKIVEKYHGKEVCIFAAELKNKKRKDDEGVYYCAE